MQSVVPSRLAARSRIHVMPLAVVSVALLIGGCAASTSGPSRVAGPIATFPGDRPRAAKPATQSVKIEIEDDGLPSQLAPRNPRPTPDDPSEPWSPNYGTARGVRSAVVPATRAEDAPAASPPPRTTASKPLDPDDVIRLAIAAHEMQRR